MAKQNVATPRFFINEALYHQAQGDYRNSVLELNPSNIRTVSSLTMPLTFDAYPTYIMLLGTSAAFTLTDDESIEYPADSVISLNPEMELAGFSLIDYPAATISSTLHLSGDLGSLSMGRYFNMPHSPELSLTLSHEYKGIKSQTTMGGATLTNVNYYKPPKWGDLEAWQLGGFPRKYSGRRVWDLSFNYLNDEDLEPESYSIDESHSSDWKDNWFSNVLYYTMGGALPFIFQPNKDATYVPSNAEITSIPEFAICRFDMDTFSREQVANNVYNIKVKIKESW